MQAFKIRSIWELSYEQFCSSGYFQSDVQKKASSAILNCKSGNLGYNVSQCTECGHTEVHNNSCRNRNCPNCQAVLKEIWIDKRRAEVIDSPYFHVVFTIPHELNDLIYCNQELLYSLFHRCSSETLLELSADRKYLGAAPGIIQVLHTWGQELNYHPHIHCIVSGGGISSDRKLRKGGKSFFIPVGVLAVKFRGKFLDYLQKLYKKEKLVFSSACSSLKNHYEWKEFKDRLYKKEWCPYIKETFNGFGNAIEYLGRYTHRIAITNGRIKEVTETTVTFSARNYKTGTMKEVTLEHTEFIRRFLMHVLPSGFQKIRYYGFLNNRMKKQNLKLIFKLQGYQKFRQLYAGMSMAELLKAIWDYDITICPECGCQSMTQLGRTHVPYR